MARAVALLALTATLAAASGCGGGPEPKPSIRILGWSVVDRAVILHVKITGWRMAAPRQGSAGAPRTGQWQIFAGDRYAGFSFDASYGTINGLAAGTYRIWAALARTDYSLVYPLIRSQYVTVRVGENGL